MEYMGFSYDERKKSYFSDCHEVRTVLVAEEQKQKWCTQMFAFWTTEGITFILCMYLK